MARTFRIVTDLFQHSAALQTEHNLFCFCYLYPNTRHIIVGSQEICGQSMQMDPNDPERDSSSLVEVLEETGLLQFHSKLTNDLQLTRLSHFDFVSEGDLIQLGLSKPAARRLLASIRKRKSFVTALKNRIVNKLIPSTAPVSAARPSGDTQVQNQPSGLLKGKTKSRLTRLFGIHDVTADNGKPNQLMPHAYHKFINEQVHSSPKLGGPIKKSLVRSHSDDLRQQTTGIKNDVVYEEPLLINFDEDSIVIPTTSNLKINSSHQQESLIDMDNNCFSAIPVQRRASDTRLDQIDDSYHLYWAGSWNTGTFYDSSTNIYSAYYCPLDAAQPPPTPINGGKNLEIDLSNRYYSVAQEDDQPDLS